MSAFEVELERTQVVRIDFDRSLFTEEFIEDFRKCFYTLHTVEEHIQHIGELAIQYQLTSDSYLEGYGKLSAMGITITHGCTTSDVNMWHVDD